MGGDGESWRVEIELPERAVMPEFDAMLEGLGGAVTAREVDNGPRWCLIAHCADEPVRSSLEQAVAAIAARVGIAPPAVTIEMLPATDWVEDYRRRTPPVTAGRFFIHPSHYAGEVPSGLIGIRLDAGLAFGTGEHATTLGCLEALAALKRAGAAVGRGLDMGCGSAILSIAAAHLWPSAAVLAVDNDPEAVRTARENIAENGCAGTVRAVEGDGYRAPAVAEAAPFDVIVANILARPLIAMAPDAAACLAADGTLVLSGLLADQAGAVLAAHEAAGLALSDRIDIDNWTTLVLVPAA